MNHPFGRRKATAKTDSVVEMKWESKRAIHFLSHITGGRCHAVDRFDFGF